jgi:hypothetical protein
MAELPARRPQKATIARDAHHHLRHAKRHDLHVAEPSPTIAGPRRQQIVSRAVDTDTEQVEVGVQRGLQSDGDKTPPTSTCPTRTLTTTKTVASII